MLEQRVCNKCKVPLIAACVLQNNVSDDGKFLFLSSCVIKVFHQETILTFFPLRPVLLFHSVSYVKYIPQPQVCALHGAFCPQGTTKAFTFQGKLLFVSGTQRMEENAEHFTYNLTQ